MTDSTDIKALIQRHYMGEAYINITNQMGPSPQLIAFVNYSNVSEDNVGLESFDIMSQHEKILEEIGNDTSLDMAMEGLIDSIKSTAEKFKNMVTFNKAENLNDLMTGKLVAKDSNILVPVADDFDRNLNAMSSTIDALKKIIAIIPGGKDQDKWKKFYHDQVDASNSAYAKATLTLRQASKVLHDNKRTVTFDKSGWSAQRLQTALKKFTALENINKQLEENIIHTCAHLEEVVSLFQSMRQQEQSDDYQRQHDISDTIDNVSKDKDDKTKRDVFSDSVDKIVREGQRQSRASHRAKTRALFDANAISAMEHVSAWVGNATSTIVAVDSWANKSLKNLSRHFEVVR